MTLLALQETLGSHASLPDVALKRATVNALRETDAAEALEFLAERQIHNVLMTGLIRDNGLVSPFNRGTFYGCRNGLGALKGVALIGHATLFEALTEVALDLFAELALKNARTRVIIGEEAKIERFWKHFDEAGHTPRLVYRELLMEQRRPADDSGVLPGLRRATLADTVQVVAAHAAMAIEEIGVDPRTVDPIGFRLRTARRISQGRVWVLIKHGKLVFKADIASDSPELKYIEGVYVPPDERGKGIGSKCLLSIGRVLLDQSISISLLVHADNKPAVAVYRKAGFQLRSYYTSIFLHNSPN